MRNAGDILYKSMEDSPELKGIFLLSRLEEIWQKAGAIFKDDFYISSFRNGILTLSGEQSIYLLHLRSMKNELQNAFNRELGGYHVAEIRFSLGAKKKISPQVKTSSESETTVPQEILNQISLFSDNFEDPRLKKSFASYLMNSFLHREKHL